MRLLLFLLLGAVLVGCSAQVGSSTDPQTATRLPTTAPETLVAVLNEAATLRADSDNTIVTPPPVDAIPPRPNEAASADTFRSDHPAHVASTGRPQLLEFFAHT